MPYVQKPTKKDKKVYMQMLTVIISGWYKQRYFYVFIERKNIIFIVQGWYNRLPHIKQLKKFTISQFHRSPVAQLISLLCVSSGQNQGVCQSGLLPEVSGGKCFSRFFYIVERIPLHVILRSKPPIFLLAVTRGSSSQFLEPVRILWLIAPFIFKAHNSG